MARTCRGAVLANNSIFVLGYPVGSVNLYKIHSDIAYKGTRFGRYGRTHAVRVATR